MDSMDKYSVIDEKPINSQPADINNASDIATAPYNMADFVYKLNVVKFYTAAVLRYKVI